MADKDKEKAIWRIVSGNPKMPYRMGNFPIYGRELRDVYKLEVELVERGLTEDEAKMRRRELNRRK